jgi:hypothetical protein
MKDLAQLFVQNPWLGPTIGYAACWVFGAAIRTMPVPGPTERWYGWAYNFLHLIGQNLENVGRKKLV